MCLTHTPHYPLLMLHTHTYPPPSHCGRASQSSISSSRFPHQTERKKAERKRERERAREQKQNAFHVFKTFTKSRKCPLFICMFWSSCFIPPHRLILMTIIQHFPCFMLFLFFFFFSRLLGCLRLGRGNYPSLIHLRLCLQDSEWYELKYYQTRSICQVEALIQLSAPCPFRQQDGNEL